MELSKELREQIEKQLPGMFASEMQDFIVQAKKDAAEVVSLNTRIETLKRSEAELRATLDGHKTLAERESALDKRLQELQTAEINLLRREAALEANIACAELQGVKETMNAFLRNVTVRQTVVADVAKPVEGSPGGNGYSGTAGYLLRDQRPDTTTTTSESQ